MVEHSDLAYRMMTRHYGADLVYTQMYNCNAFLTSKDIRELSFTTTEADRPLIVQFAGHEPQALLAAAKMVFEVCIIAANRNYHLHRWKINAML